MKRFFCLILFVSFLGALPPKELFDDFNYRAYDDSVLKDHGWIVVDGMNAPPSGANYDKTLIDFEKDPRHPDQSWMTLSSIIPDTCNEIRHSRIESTDKYHEGTYAARIFFDHALRKTRDGNIQTFYLITPLDHPNDTLYSECDFEYLSYDIWSAANNKRSAIYASTWETYQPEPYVPDHAMTTEKRNLYGWHTLILVMVDNEVKYYIDKNDEAFAVHRYSDKGSTVFPESDIQVAFANWISVISDKIMTSRSSTMKVDWFYHAPDTALGFYEIMGRINELRKQKLTYTNNIE